MLAENSPLLNLPTRLDKKQGVFLDGLAHAAQIAGFAYMRLCAGLTEQVSRHERGEKPSSFIPQFLDAWAFIDATDRFRFLWGMQPESRKIPPPFSPNLVGQRLDGMCKLRNVSAHIAQKIDLIVAKNSSVLGEISWLTVTNKSPLAIKTCFIRPGVARDRVSAKLAMPPDKVSFCNASGHVAMRAGEHRFLLSDAHECLNEIVLFAEASLGSYFASLGPHDLSPRDLFGIADLEVQDP